MFGFWHLSPAFESTTLNTQWFMTGTRSLGRDVYNHPQRAITARVTAPQVLFFVLLHVFAIIVQPNFICLFITDYSLILIPFAHVCYNSFLPGVFMLRYLASVSFTSHFVSNVGATYALKQGHADFLGHGCVFQ